MLPCLKPSQGNVFAKEEMLASKTYRNAGIPHLRPKSKKPIKPKLKKPHNMSNKAGLLIRAARKRKKLSQRELARKTGIDFTYVSKIEQGKLDYAPKAAVLTKLAVCLDLDLHELKRLYGQLTTEWVPSTIVLLDYAG